MKRQYLSFADWSGQEYVAIARSLVTGQINQGPHKVSLTCELAQMYAPSTVYLTNYGHHAMALALKIFQRLQTRRNEVIVPAYICPSVIQVVQACGLKVRCVDVQDDLNICPRAMKDAINPNTLAVIAAHMYGCPAHIEEIEATCACAGVFLIDDAAQVVGVRAGGRLLGTYGDAGVISFAQSKIIVTGIKGSGGGLLVNNPQLESVAQLAWRELPESNHRLGASLDFLWNYVWGAYTGYSGYYLGRLLSYLDWRAETPSIATQISNLEAGIALAQLRRLDVILNEKIRVASLYHKALAGSSHILFPQYEERRLLARVMFLVPSVVNINQLRTTLKSQGIETRAGYEVCITDGALPRNAENVASRLIGLPMRPGMTQAEVTEICGIMAATISTTLHSPA